MNSPHHFRSALLRELTTVVERRAIGVTEGRGAAVALPGRRGLARLSAAVAGVAVLAIGASVLLTARSDSRAFAVTRLPDGRIEISVDEDFDDAVALEAELLAAGIEVEVEEIPASPSMVGRVIEADLTDPVERDELMSVTGQDATRFIPSEVIVNGLPMYRTMTIDPKTLRGVLRLQVGVRAAPGELYHWRAVGSVYAPGEVLDGLHCVLGDETVTVAMLAPHLEPLGSRIVWWVLNTQPGDRYGAFEEQAEVPPLDAEVEYVEQTPSGHVTVNVGSTAEFIGDNGEDGFVTVDPVTGEEVRESDLPTLSERFPCTPELAARWE